MDTATNGSADHQVRRPVLCIARPVGLGFEHHDTGTYLADVSVRAYASGLFSAVHWTTTTQHRILEARNNLAQKALDCGADYLLFLDPDMDPNAEQDEPHYAPFMETSIKFLEELKAGKHGMPEGSLGIIAAPALSGPPEYKCNVFAGAPNNMRRVTQQEAMDRKGCIDRVVGIGTAVMMIPTAVFKKLPQPWFDDVYENDIKSKVWITQDINFCQQCNSNGVSVWCSWYSFATHYKTVGIGRPDKHMIAGLEDRKNADKGEWGTPDREGSVTLSGLIQEERRHPEEAEVDGSRNAVCAEEVQR